MTTTDELQALLDERGVEWWEATPCKTKWNSPIIGGPVAAREWNGEMVLDTGYIAVTPEQAIAATLGETPTPPPPTMPEQPPYDLLIDLLRDEWDIDVSWDGLRRFWYVGLTDEGVRKRDEREATLGTAYEPPVAAHWDGDTLTLTIPRDPSCIRVQRSFEQPCKVYADESKVIAATLGSCNCSSNCTNSERTGTCHPVISDNLTESEGTGDAWADCSECGHLLFVLTDPNSQVPNFCPNCGRRIEQ